MSIKEEKHYVYHIHRVNNLDLSQGYIGVSKKPKHRWRAHKYGGNAHLENAINKYDDIQYNIIDEGSKEYCLYIEYSLRPTDHIGWNIAKGGGMPPTMKGADNPMFGRVSPRRGKNRPMCECKRISKSLKKLYVQGILTNKGVNNPRYGDHRNYIEIHGTEKAQQITQRFSTKRSGSGNANARKWKLTSPIGHVEIIDGNCKQRLINLNLSMRALKDNIGESYAINAQYRNTPSPTLLNTVGWKLEKL